MTEIIQNPTTGAFYIGDKCICIGYHGTQTIVGDVANIKFETEQSWTLTKASLDGSNLRIFSISRDVYNTLTFRFQPWRQSNDRVWFMTTFKNIEGHKGRWNSEKTFGQMFEEIAGPQCINVILEQTKTQCISYLLRHVENDLFGNLKQSHIIQTIIWNGEEYIGIHMAEWTSPPSPILEPELVSNSNKAINPFDVEIKDGCPLLLTIFNNHNIYTTKYITAGDETFRRFRCRAHSINACLFLLDCAIFKQKIKCEQTHEHTDLEEYENLKVEKNYVYKKLSSQEKDRYEEALAVGRTNFYNDLQNKKSGMYVVFPKLIYVIIQSMFSKDCDEIWNKFRQNAQIPAVEQFFSYYPNLY